MGFEKKSKKSAKWSVQNANLQIFDVPDMMERISQQKLYEDFDNVLERVDKEDIGFVMLYCELPVGFRQFALQENCSCNANKCSI